MWAPAAQLLTAANINAVLALKRLGYNVLSAGGPDEALALVRSLTERIDLLLTDVVMPGNTGPHLANEMARVLPGVRVVFMSGYTDDAIALCEILDSGVFYIAKPFTARSLGETVRKALGARAAAGQQTG